MGSTPDPSRGAEARPDADAPSDLAGSLRSAASSLTGLQPRPLGDQRTQARQPTTKVVARARGRDRLRARGGGPPSSASDGTSLYRSAPLATLASSGRRGADTAAAAWIAICNKSWTLTADNAVTDIVPAEMVTQVTPRTKVLGEAVGRHELEDPAVCRGARQTSPQSLVRVPPHGDGVHEIGLKWGETLPQRASSAPGRRHPGQRRERASRRRTHRVPVDVQKQGY